MYSCQNSTVLQSWRFQIPSQLFSGQTCTRWSHRFWLVTRSWASYYYCTSLIFAYVTVVAGWSWLKLEVQCPLKIFLLPFVWLNFQSSTWWMMMIFCYCSCWCCVIVLFIFMVMNFYNILLGKFLHGSKRLCKCENSEQYWSGCTRFVLYFGFCWADYVDLWMLETSYLTILSYVFISWQKFKCCQVSFSDNKLRNNVLQVYWQLL